MVSPLPDDNAAYRFPVSVKGVVFLSDQVVLLKNNRDEWELPGGKLELGESPERCVAREIAEELSIDVQVGPILDSWVYHIGEGVDVLIVTYGCYAGSSKEAAISSEHQALGLFTVDDLDGLPLPPGYRRSIETWCQRLADELR